MMAAPADTPDTNRHHPTPPDTNRHLPAVNGDHFPSSEAAPRL